MARTTRLSLLNPTNSASNSTYKKAIQWKKTKSTIGHLTLKIWKPTVNGELLNSLSQSTTNKSKNKFINRPKKYIKKNKFNKKP